jgi:hypothetical protein
MPRYRYLGVVAGPTHTIEGRLEHVAIPFDARDAFACERLIFRGP